MRTLSSPGNKSNQARFGLLLCAPLIFASVVTGCIIGAMTGFIIGAMTGCGGGGSDEDFVGAAIVSITGTPSRIDTGDRTQIAVQIHDVHPNGISLKLRFPDGLRFVHGSGLLTVSGEGVEVIPTVNTRDENERVYVVFYLPQSDFGDKGNKSGVLTLELEGTAAIREGKVEVDADVDDPHINNDVEFDINNPEFSAEDETGITVE
jgi:hypothetical protein